MSAVVNTIYRHQAVCPDCGWWGEEIESEEAAERDVDEHNTEYHTRVRSWETLHHSGICRICGMPSDWADGCSAGCVLPAGGGRA
jgi:hypothetical protein